MNAQLDFDGERYIPGAPGEIWYEHWHRYHFAAALIGGREVLDVACGAGYGSVLLAGRSRRVVGADLSEAAIAYARERYAAIPNVEFLVANCAALPFPDAAFDAVVSFETLEHIGAQERFFDEVRRLLRPGGLLVLSCPNRLEYSERRGCTNPFHVRELTRDELAAMLAPRFAHALWYGQRMSFFSVIWPERSTAGAGVLEVSESDAAGAGVFEVSESTADAASAGHTRPLYFIVVASDRAATIEALAPTLSVLADRDERVYADYERAVGAERAAWERGNTLEREVAAWQGHHATAVAERDAIGARNVEVERQLVDAARGLEAQRGEIERRGSLRWWLILPVRWLRDALFRSPPR